MRLRRRSVLSPERAGNAARVRWACVYRAACRKPRMCAVPRASRRGSVQRNRTRRGRIQASVDESNPALRREVHRALRRDTADAARSRDRDDARLASRASPVLPAELTARSAWAAFSFALSSSRLVCCVIQNDGGLCRGGFETRPYESEVLHPFNLIEAGN